jgi:hypothetical protein
MDSKVIAVKWKTGRDCIGIVAVDTGFGIKGYIKTVSGMDQDGDIKQVAEWGTRLEVSEIIGFFPERSEEFAEIGYSN